MIRLHSLFHGKRVILILITLLFCVGCDQKTKSIARENLRDVEAKSFLHDTFRLEYAENSGAFLGLGDSLPAPWRTAIFSFGCSIGIAAALLYTLFAVHLRIFQIFALSLVIAGGVGNLMDRWTLGHSTDFLNIGIGSVRTGIFNLADVAIMSGCFLIFWTQRRRPIAAPFSSHRP